MAAKIGRVIFGVFFSFLLGCAPVISQAIIDKSEFISFRDARETPEKYVGKIVILGGTVVNALNTPKGLELEVLQRPLGYGMEPVVGDKTAGRFLVRMDRVNQVNQLQRGRKITFAAEIIGKETRPLDQTQYTYLLLRAREFHIWPENGSGFFQNLRFSLGASGSL